MSNIDDAGIVVLMIAKYNDENKKTVLLQL